MEKNSDLTNSTISDPDQPEQFTSNKAAVWTLGRELPGGLIVDRILGKGGMGCLYLVRRKSDGYYYAVKTLH